MTTTRTPRAAPTVTPTPRQAEFDSFVRAMSNGTLPHTYAFYPDGSPVDPQSPNQTQPPPTWPGLRRRRVSQYR